MISINLKSLINTLNAVCRTTLEGAAGLCLTRTQYNVEIEHWLMKLIESSDNDVAIILEHFDVNMGRLKGDLNRSLDRLRTGNSKSPALSPDVIDWARSAWLLASLEYQAPQIRSAHLMMALMADESLSRLAKDLSHEFQKISLENFQEQWENLLAQSPEAAGESQTLSSSPTNNATGGVGIQGSSTTNEALNQFTIDLTERARKGELDPVLGRDNEIRQIADILLRRRQNNPILTGEAGVGKTAVVEGFALRVVAGDVPPALRNIAIRILDLTLLQAGAGMKGEFENRLNAVIKGVKSSPQPIVLFIDEAHTLIGAGGGEGQGDAANILKPALARGELRTIAATTWAEYKKYFEKDAALARRFQVVKVEEPSEEGAIEMMRGIAADLEKHHHVRVLDEAIVASVKLSKRYIQGRQLPDKSVSLLDIACAKVGMGHTTDPASIEDLQRRIEQTQLLLENLKRESVTGVNHQERIKLKEVELASTQSEYETLKTRFDAEKGIVRRVRLIRYRLEQLHKGEALTTPVDPLFADPAALEGTAYAELKTASAFLKALKAEEDQLKVLQGEYPLLQVCVDAQAVAAVVSSWTGIPLGRMVSDEIRSVLDLENKLAERVIGQEHALSTIAETIHIARSGLGDPRKPIGVFMLAGTSGTGKTETALALADLLYGGEQNMTTINMSEFKEEHKVSMLLGSPPGYVGYGEGGVLTNAVRRRPYSVILLDEMEKAHPGVQDIFYQVFDKGKIMDGEGREVDFKNTVIIMTTNAGTRSIMEAYSGDPDKMPNTAGELSARIRPELLKTFKPAFLGRINVIPYIPLDEEVIQKIVVLQLVKVGKRIAEHYNATFNYKEDLVAAISARCTEVETGARNVEHIITNTLLPALANEFLSKMAAAEPVKSVTVKVNKKGEFAYTLA
jgi:type VI secretion system protein VasG